MVPRPACLGLVILLLGAGPAAAGEGGWRAQTGLPSLERAQAMAKAARKALVLEFGTTWCGQCKIFEDQVLRSPQVKKALPLVMFFRYDAEAGPGIAAARALRVVGFPTLIARAQDGSEIGRIQGVPSAPDFSRWLTGMAAESEPLEILEARAGKEPQDGKALLALSRRLKKRGDHLRSRQALERALAAASGRDEQVAASAHFDLKLDHLRQALREEPRRAMAEHLLRYPRGPTAEAALQALSRLGPADKQAREALRTYIDARKADVDEDAVAINNAVYACLRAAAYDEAERGARKLIEAHRESAMYLDTLAEVMHMRGESAEALKLSEQALGLVGKERERQDELRAALVKNQARFRRGNREPPLELSIEDDEPFPWERE